MKRKISLKSLIAIVPIATVSLLPITSCKTTKKTEKQVVHVDSVEIDYFITEKYVPGSKYNYTSIDKPIKLDIKVLPSEATNKKVVWEVEDEDVATIDENGVVTPKDFGVTTIKATSVDGSKTDTINFVVLYDETKGKDIQILNPKNSINVGETYELEAKILPEDAIPYIWWTSENEDVATISDDQMTSNARIVGLSAGSTKIRGTNYDETIVKEFDLKVNNLTETKHIEDISFTPNTLNTLTLGKDMPELTAKITPVDATLQGVIWSVDDSRIADYEIIDTKTNTIRIYPLNVGSTTITATSQGTTDGTNKKTIRININVEGQKIFPSSIKIKEKDKENKITIVEGSGMQLSCEFYPQDTTDKSIEWTSSNPEIVGFVKDGIIKAYTPGKSTITARAKGIKEGQSEVIDQCEVEVLVEQCDITLTSNDKGTIKQKTIKGAKGSTFSQALKDANVEYVPNEYCVFSHWLDKDGQKISDDYVIRSGFTAKAIFNRSFELDSWANVINFANQGLDKLKEAYSVDTFIGKEKQIMINGHNHKVRVIGENHDFIAGTSKKSKAALTFELVTLLSDSNGKAMQTIWDTGNNFNYTHGNLHANLNGGYERKQDWTNSEGKKTSAYDMLPDVLRTGIKKVEKEVAEKNDSVSNRRKWNYFWYECYLFPLTTYELGVETEYREGYKYAYWQNHSKDADRIKEDVNGYLHEYWLASPYTDEELQAYQVNTDGGLHYKNKRHIEQQKGVAFGFCI